MCDINVFVMYNYITKTLECVTALRGSNDITTTLTYEWVDDIRKHQYV